MAGSGSVIEEARNLIRERLDTLEDERKRLEGALKELGGKVKRSKPGPKPGAKPGSGKRAPRKRGGETRLQQLLKFLSSNPAVKVKDAAAALEISPSQVSGLISKAKEGGLLNKDDNQQWVVKVGGAPSDDGGEKGSASDAGKPSKPKRRKKAAAKKASRKKAAAKKPASDDKGKAGAKDGGADAGKSGDGEKGSGDSGSQTPAAASS